MKNLYLKGGKALIAVAHPDDETIWMGGTILQYKNVDWTILVLSRRNDSDRYPKFLRAVKFYRARGIISDLEDEGIFTLKESLPEIKKIISRYSSQKKFDYIFTHGSNGEYGHKRHKGVHLAVKKMVKQEDLSGSNLFFFSYNYKKEKKICLPNKKADFFLNLSSKVFETKKNIIKNIYGFKQNSFEFKSCSKKETFIRL